MNKKYKPLDQELIKLTQDLIRIPSWIPDQLEKRTTQNENKVVDYLEKWLKKNTNMEIEKQPLDQGRFNLIAKKGKPDLLFLAHTDTECDFLGMKGLVKKYSKLKPKLIVSSDGSDLKIGHGCRGLIDIRVRVTGKTGHAARANGLNAIDGATQSLASLSNLLKQYKHKQMGLTSMNLAYLVGGSKEKNSLSKDNTLSNVGQQGNVIPDVCEFVIDIRPATPDLTPEIITQHLKTYLTKNGYELEIIKLRHNLGAWYTDITQVKSVLKLAQEITNTPEPQLDNPSEGGYIDLQMLWNKVGRPPAVMFGGGDGSTAHAANEYIKISDLIKTRDFFVEIIKGYCSNKTS